MTGKESDHPGFFESIWNAVVELRTAFESVVGKANRWFRNRSRLVQVAAGGGVAWAVQMAFERFPAVIDTLSVISRVSTNQLLIVLIGVGVGQTYLQLKGFYRIRTDVLGEGMEEPVSDGGTPTDSDGEADEPETTGGMAIGGAIAGAALGSSYGPGGTVAGAVLGLVLGDELEKNASKTEGDDGTN